MVVKRWDMAINIRDMGVNFSLVVFDFIKKIVADNRIINHRTGSVKLDSNPNVGIASCKERVLKFIFFIIGRVIVVSLSRICSCLINSSSSISSNSSNVPSFISCTIS